MPERTKFIAVFTAVGECFAALIAYAKVDSANNSARVDQAFTTLGEGVFDLLDEEPDEEEI